MQVTLNLTVFAASAFKAHSLVSTVYVVQAVSFCELSQATYSAATNRYSHSKAIGGKDC